MKIPLASPRNVNGSILLMACLTAAVAGITLVSYLTLCQFQRHSVVRSISWNASLPAAEAGIEEALSHLKVVGSGPRNSNGWTQVGTNFVMNRDFGQWRYLTTISSASEPVIFSIGTTKVPITGKLVSRTIEVTTKRNGTFQKGITAKGKLTMSGQFEIDSYDSSNPAHSTNGRYDSDKRKDNGDVGTNLGTSDAVDLSGQVKVFGRAATGAGGQVKWSGQAVVGTESYINAGNTGVQSGRSSSDMNVSFPNVVQPFGSAPTPPQNQNVGGTNYTWHLSSGNWYMGTVSLSGQQKMMVSGDATLLVDQDVSLSGQSFIYLAPGATLNLYVKKGAIKLSGQGIGNSSGMPQHFNIYGMPDMKDMDISGNGHLVGTIYAPQASLKLSGGGNDSLDFIGAAIVDTFTASGHFKLHYDEALGYGSLGSYVVITWREL